MIFITGYMASGKTVIGKRLAAYLQLPFYDLDECITQSSGFTIAEIFALQGEDGFRQIENELLQKLVAEIPKQSVVALGGGTPCFHNNMHWLKNHGITVYLQTPLHQIRLHLSNQKTTDRPLIAQKQLLTGEALEQHLRERAPFYEASHVKIPLKLAKNPDLLTKTLILFTTSRPDLNYLHEFP